MKGTTRCAICPFGCMCGDFPGGKKCEPQDEMALGHPFEGVPFGEMGGLEDKGGGGAANPSRYTWGQVPLWPFLRMIAAVRFSSYTPSGQPLQRPLSVPLLHRIISLPLFFCVSLVFLFCLYLPCLCLLYVCTVPLDRFYDS